MDAQQNPIAAAARAETLYDKLNNLAAEISEGIINLSGQPRAQMQAELALLREASFRERSPEAVYSTALFRKYADLANNLSTPNRQTFMGELPSFVYEGDDENMLVGWEATKTSIFRLRGVAWLFSLLSMAVMSSVPDIDDAEWSPSDYFESGCEYNGLLSGSFNFKAYQLVIAVAVMSLVFQGLALIYYALPADSEGMKYIPSLSALLGTHASEHAAMSFLKFHLTTISVCGDGFLTFMGILAFIVSEFIFASAVQMNLSHEGGTIVEYYTLSTVYKTYSDATDCLTGEDPSPKIRGADAMLFFAVIATTLCFLVSFRSLREQMGHGMCSGFSGHSPDSIPLLSLIPLPSPLF
eukprot:CAMPEP_0173325454 /NCGR_PEP_ID=MMETSP1144-20121109/516_1 /TAXON_ID=483371 /ORGANISM="non described non described, Strain CCMP2298" /LENGTH=353 /DNA_ID=CAMNT_0014269649 /DNA_START=49 /DNA_END=1113 /DNA_ORIENTATION=-